MPARSGADGNPKGFDPRQGFNQGGGFRQGPFAGAGGGDAGTRDFRFTWDNAAPGGGGAGGGFNAEDLFAEFLGGGRGRGGRGKAQKGEDFSADVTVSFEEAANGGTRRVVLANGEQIDVKIPVGVKEGQVIRVKGRGGAGRGGPNGDVLLQVQVAPPPLYDPRRQRPAHGPAGDPERGGTGGQGAGADPHRDGEPDGAAPPPTPARCCG